MNVIKQTKDLQILISELSELTMAYLNLATVRHNWNSFRQGLIIFRNS